MYDSKGRLIKESRSDGSYIEYIYEGESDRISSEKAYISKDVLEREVVYSYDGLGRMTEDLSLQKRPINYVDPSGHKRKVLGYGMQVELSLSCGFVGMQFIWLNKNVKTRYNKKMFHVFWYGGGSFAATYKKQVENNINKNPTNLKSKSGLKKLGKKIRSNVSASTCIIAIIGDTKKVDSYKDIAGPFIGFTLTGAHATASFGIGQTSSIAGFGVSSSKVSISMSAGYAYFGAGLTNKLRKSMGKISSYVKGKASKL